MSREKINIKSISDIEKMTECGKRLAEVKVHLKEKVKVGVNAYEVEELANKLIEKLGGMASFKMVPNYSWATCINVNEGIVHGIPKKTIVFNDGDIVSVDVGMFYKGFHTDTSFSVGLNVSDDLKSFLEVGKLALKKAINKTRPGNRIFDISDAIGSTLKSSGLTPVRALVGHGVGRELHEDPQIPCFISGKREDTLEISEGAVFAIEVMYTQGRGEIAIEDDGWTIVTSDDTISALFEDSVAVTKSGPIVLT